MVLVDSWDSFTYNLSGAFSSLGADVEVVQSESTSPAEVCDMSPDFVVLGPGPGHPAESGCLVELVGALGGRIPMLGVCLGHQAIGLAFGARVRHHDAVHGHATPIRHDGKGLFTGLPPDVPMTRYHSIVVDQLPPSLVATAHADDGAIMAVRHRTLPIAGVQFHPESVLSGRFGLQLLANFLSTSRRANTPRTSRTERTGTWATTIT